MEKTPEVQASSDSSATKPNAPIDMKSRERVTLTQGRGGVVGVKAGMTQVYTDNGDSIAVTVIDLKPAVITQVKTQEKNGYQAVQIGFLEKKSKATTKPEQGHVKASGATGFYHYQEFRISKIDKLNGLA